MRKLAENGEVYVVEWISMVHGEKVFEEYTGTFDIFFRIEHRLRK